MTSSSHSSSLATKSTDPLPATSGGGSTSSEFVHINTKLAQTNLNNNNNNDNNNNENTHPISQQFISPEMHAQEFFSALSSEVMNEYNNLLINQSIFNCIFGFQFYYLLHW